MFQMQLSQNMQGPIPAAPVPNSGPDQAPLIQGPMTAANAKWDISIDKANFRTSTEPMLARPAGSHIGEGTNRGILRKRKSSEADGVGLSRKKLQIAPSPQMFGSFSEFKGQETTITKHLNPAYHEASAPASKSIVSEGGKEVSSKVSTESCSISYYYSLFYVSVISCNLT